jgi:hypothetical protein
MTPSYDDLMAEAAKIKADYDEYVAPYIQGEDVLYFTSIAALEGILCDAECWEEGAREWVADAYACRDRQMNAARWFAEVGLSTRTFMTAVPKLVAEIDAIEQILDPDFDFDDLTDEAF